MLFLDVSPGTDCRCSSWLSLLQRYRLGWVAVTSPTAYPTGATSSLTLFSLHLTKGISSYSSHASHDYYVRHIYHRIYINFYAAS